MDNKYKELRRNTLIIGVANLGSKAISFILAPLYSYWITVEQYGDMDLIISTVLLLTPVVCLDIYDATFRFASDSKYDNRTVLSVSLLFSFPCVALCAVISVVSALILGNHLLAFSSIYLALNLIESAVQQYERGRNHLVIFAISGITDSVVLLLFNLVFLIGLRMQITGWIISVILAKLIACGFLMVKSDCIRTFSLSSVRKDAVTDMLRFCIPLLPNTMMWWIMNLSDRYMIKIFVGAAATGLYSVANKIPNILSIFENVFYQSWQTSTIINLDRSDREEFYSDVFNKYLGILAIGVISLLAFSKELTWLLFDDKFRDAWPAIAPLIIGVMVHALSTNIGALYVAFKQTKGAFRTSLIGAITNIILNLLFIPRFGMVAAAYTTLIGYMVTFGSRWIDIRKYVKLSIRKSAIFYMAVLLLQTFLFYYPLKYGFYIRIAIAMVMVIRDYKLILGLVRR